MSCKLAYYIPHVGTVDSQKEEEELLYNFAYSLSSEAESAPDQEPEPSLPQFVDNGHESSAFQFLNESFTLCN